MSLSEAGLAGRCCISARTPSRARQSPLRADLSASAYSAGDVQVGLAVFYAPTAWFGGVRAVVVPEPRGASDDEDGGDSGSLVPGSPEGGSALGVEEDGAVDVGGQVVGVPLSVPGEEAHGDDGDDGVFGVVVLTDGEGFAGGSVRWSCGPCRPCAVRSIPRCRGRRPRRC